MTLLDTNVLSALMRKTPDPQVVAWLDRQPRTSVWITSVTILEIQFGIRILAAGRRRAMLTEAFEAIVTEEIAERVANFDAAAARLAAGLMAARQKKGRPTDLRDTMIAGIALACHATLATRNTRHFEDLSVPVVDPWSA